MSYNFKEIMSRPERLAPGHRMCAGCGGTIAARNVLRALHPGDHAVIGNATGCMEVSTFMYPYTAWQDSYIHNAFENAGATISGVEGALRLSSCMAISQGFSRLIVPKRGIIGKVMYIFSLMQSSFRETEGSLMERIARTLELGGAVKTQNKAVNIPPFTLIGISIAFIALATLGFLFY